MVKCEKCGFDNPPNMKFCGNCGSRLEAIVEPRKFEGLALLHITGSAYLIISLIFNSLVQASLIFTILYVASALLGLYSGYKFYTDEARRYLKIASALAIIIGLASTFMLFIIGLGVRGVIGPAWIIFVINAWALWRERKRL